MVSILFMVGDGKEEPSIVQQMLNVQLFPCKPEYHFVDGLPLVLSECNFEGIEWINDKGNFIF
jgi:tRNA pseudouridine38/39 synthase